ncbi:L,D-transpeptidase [Streptomyces minutiscleroticus]|uniref:L,D-TPase catalytic domain-containing protein n=1 Tax=Streptomyces minutiscleroticus TaxID=68238 RepID=A0A918KUH4_9ACTN|nr:L,D-transpeptidase [Streptomyces minutiscleroticus]GGX73944.1 hypothetical protein GCM10010358_30400 [Streptomyces minutiscleroticus]
MSGEPVPGGPGKGGTADGGSGGTAGGVENGSELSSLLRELAAAHETPAPVSGAEIRGRAVRRGCRRRATAAASGATGAAALALALTLAFTGAPDGRHGHGQHGHTAADRPAASTSATPSSPAAGRGVPVARVDLARRVLTVAGRTLPISSGAERTPTPTGRMTVIAKYEITVVPGTRTGSGTHGLKAPWVIELRAPGDRTGYILALTHDEKAPGARDRTGGWIGLRTRDAKWLYQRLAPGAAVEVEGSAPDAGRSADAGSAPASPAPGSPGPESP